MNKFYNTNSFKLWSKLGQRAVFGLGMLEIIKKHKDLIVVTADVSTSAGLDRFRKNFKDNYVDVGIAEQNMIGIAAGMASEGHKVITTTFSPFQTLRCSEQIKVMLGYMKIKVVMVGLASGLVLGPLGFTHCSIEDVSLLRSIPNISIVCPSDPTEVIKATEASLNYDRSVYIRLTGSSNTRQIYYEDYDFKIGESITLKNGSDISIISNGSIIAECLDTAKFLETKGISVEVINMHTIKPLDKKKLNEIFFNKKLIVSVEEHNVIGGLSSSIAEEMSEIKNKPPLIKIGINDFYSSGGSYDFLKSVYKIKSQDISNTILKYYEQS